MSTSSGMFISPVPRNITLNTGYTFQFENDKETGEPTPVYVPPSARSELLQYGCIPVDGDFKSVSPDVVKEKDNTPPPSGVDRTSKLRSILLEMGREGNPDDFSGGGVPKVPRVQKRAGFEVSAKERDNVWMDIVQSGELN